MQAVILAAGKGTRLHPLTLTRPKPLLKVANKTVLEHNLDQLVGLVDHVFIVVNYLKEQIVEKIGKEYCGMPVSYVEQKEPLGTGDAVSSALPFLNDEFIVVCGDDMYFKEDIQRAVENKPCIVAKETEHPERFGVVIAEGGKFRSIVEKPEKPESNLVNTGLYCLRKEFFETKISPSERGEYELVDYLSPLGGGELNVIIAEKWISIGYPWHLLDANKFLIERMEDAMDRFREKSLRIEGIVEEGCTIKDNVWVGAGTVIKSGTYLEQDVVIGKNCRIGPNCHIRGATSVGDDCHVGQAAEIKNSIIFDKTNIPHLNYIGDSVIGSGSNLGAGTIIANLRHDNMSVKAAVKGEFLDTGRRKLGAIIGDNVKTGIGTLIYPGRKIWPNTWTRPKDVVDEDIEK